MALAPYAVKAHTKAANAAAKSDLTVMIVLLKNDRSIAYDFKQSLVASGKWPENGVLDKRALEAMGRNSFASPCKPKTEKKEEESEQALASTPGTGETPELSPSPSKPIGDWKLSPSIHRNFKTWDRVPPAQLRRLISDLALVSRFGNNL